MWNENNMQENKDGYWISYINKDQKNKNDYIKEPSSPIPSNNKITQINDVNVFNINNIIKEDVLIKQDKNNKKYYFIIINLETCNGISRKNNSIVQLSFMILGTNYIYDTYSKPDESIPWMVGNKYFISNITKNTVKYSPNLKDVLLSFLKIISIFNNIEPIFIAHNSSFNKDILKLCFDFYNINFEYDKWCNTMNKDFFNIRDNNGKFIKSLKKIEKILLNENEQINLNNSKNNLYILYKCLLKIHKCDDKISFIIFKSMNIDEKIDNNNEDSKIILSNLLNEYNEIINKEKEILNHKMIIENQIKKFLKSDDYLIINNKKISYKEITLKTFFEENINKDYKKIYITDLK